MLTIRERILARSDIDELRDARDLDGIADALNAEQANNVSPRWVTGRTILAECPDAEDILAALEAVAAAGSVATRWVVRFLAGDPGVDMGNLATRMKTETLVSSGALPREQADQLLDLAVRPVVVTRLDVEAALYNPDGSEKE